MAHAQSAPLGSLSDDDGNILHKNTSKSKKSRKTPRRKRKRKRPKTCAVVRLDRQITEVITLVGEDGTSKFTWPALDAGDENGDGEIAKVNLKLPVITKSAHQTPTGSPVCADSRRTAGKENAPPKSAKQPDRKRRERRLPVLVAVKPLNQELERERFIQASFNYNPRFLYRQQLAPEVSARYDKPSDTLIPLAIKIMKHALKRFGSYEDYEQKTGGRYLTRAQIFEAAKRYLRKEGVEDEVQVMLCNDLVPRACMTRVKGNAVLQVRSSNIREYWMEGLLRHEIGTHFIRSSNNRHQTWRVWKNRKELDLFPFNPTEEGLAALHSVLMRSEPSLWRAAMLYYTAFQASKLSFSALFRDLGQFVQDPNVRWDYCLRAKRGQIDTSLPGSFSKDQVYLKGALEILKHRQDIDFHLLTQLGKVCYRDVNRLKEVGNIGPTRVPSFMKDLTVYRARLDRIVGKNGLTDEDLSSV